jgi:hypothetical protein
VGTQAGSPNEWLQCDHPIAALCASDAWSCSNISFSIHSKNKTRELLAWRWCRNPNVGPTNKCLWLERHANSPGPRSSLCLGAVFHRGLTPWTGGCRSASGSGVASVGGSIWRTACQTLLPQARCPIVALLLKSGSVDTLRLEAGAVSSSIWILCGVQVVGRQRMYLERLNACTNLH